MNDKTKTGSSDGGSKNPPENTDEVKSLSELLAEWPDETKQAKAPKDGEPDEKSRLDALEQRADSTDRRSSESDMASLVTRVRGDLKVDDWMVRAWILNEASNDSKMDALWDSREANSGVLDKIVKDALIPGFKKYAEGKILPPETARKQDAGLAAAVRGARESNSKPSSLDNIAWGELSDADFQVKKSEVFRAAKAGELV